MNNHSVENSDTVSNEIRVLHDTYGLSFRQIAALPLWDGIPAGTICDIYHGARVPNKWRKQLGIPKLVKVPENMVRTRPYTRSSNGTPRIAVSKTDPTSAARSLLGNIETGTLRQVMIEVEERMNDG